MTKRKAALGTFQKVGECLYRYSSNGVYYGLVKQGGKQIRRSLKTSDRKLAERRLAEFRSKVERLKPLGLRSNSKRPASGINFGDLSMQWFSTVAPSLKPSSARRREGMVSNLCKTFGSVLVRNITQSDCSNWSKKRIPTCSASTYNKELETLNLVLKYAEQEGVILDNPCRNLKRRKQGKAAILIPSKEQFYELLKTMRATDPRYYPAANLVELLAYSGMRLGEATELRWRDVDLENGRFTVTGGETGTKNHEARIVPMFPALEKFLLERKEVCEPSKDDPVIRIKSAKKAIAHSCRVANLPNFTHHCFRHFFVSNAIEKGIDFKTIAAWVGHKDGGVLVAQTYGHLRDTHSMEMAKRMTL